MASGVELATAYISIVGETSQLKRDAAKAIGEVDRQASKTKVGKNLFAGAGADASRAGRDTGMKFGTAVKGALAAAGIAASAATVVAGIKQVFDSGLNFERNANTFQAVTRASVAEMEKMRAKARELGNDVSLTGASASDALTAMTELSKAGFSIQQSMDGAKGSLQLASAAQVSAAEAAGIQANALMAFGKGAEYASTAADVLANGANASSAEITDVAYALQAAGAVANQFGVSMEDTVASIGMLANAGIKGSDAGTLLKSMLLAIASPSDQASQAMGELGLSVWDAQGNFVGMRSVMEQLQAASQRMTPEMYAMSASTAFGSDAARLAGVAAQQGGEGFDVMRTAVARQGAAAEVAAAQTQGLPGVLERLSNTAESAKLALFGLLDGPAQAGGNWVNDLANDALDAFEGLKGGQAPTWMAALIDAGKDALPALKSLGATAAEVVKILGGAALKAAVTALSAIGAVAGEVVVPALDLMASLLEGNGKAVAAVAVAFAAWKFLPGLLTSIGTPLQKLGSTVSGSVVTGVKAAGTAAVETATALKGLVTANNAVVGSMGGTATQMGRFGSTIAQIGTHVPVVARMQDAFIQGAVGADRFGRTVGAAKAAMTGFRAAGSAISGMFGGPWGAALTAATIGLTLWSQSVSDANQRAKTLEANTRAIEAAGHDMYEAFAKSGGNVDDTVMAKVNDQVNTLYDTLETKRKGASIADWFKSATTTIATFGQASSSFDASNIQETAEQTEQMMGTMRELGLTQEQISATIYSSSGSWEMLRVRLNDAGQGGRLLLAQLAPLRQSFLDNKAAAENLTPGVTTLQESISVLADTTANAEQKTNALRTALDVLAGKQPDVQEATAQYNETVQQVAQTTQEAWDAQKGYGAALVNADGTVNTTTENGLKLYEALKQLRDATINVAGAGGDVRKAFAENEAQFASLATAAGLTKEQIRAMSEQMGLVPSRIEMLMTLNGTTDTKQQLTLVRGLISDIPPGTTITVDALTQDAIEQLRGMGFKVEEFKAANGQTQIKITANAQQAVDELGRVTAAIRSIDIAVAGQGQNSAPRPQPWHPGQFTPYDPAGGGRAKGGPIFGSGRKGKDSVPIVAAPGEHMWTDKEVDAVGGHGNMYALRAAALAGAIPGFSRGGPIPMGHVINPVDPKPAPAGPGGALKPNPRPGSNPNEVAFPDWSKQGKWGGPPPGFFLKPSNPDDFLFPDMVAPGKRDQQREIWEKLNPKIQPLGLEQGGPVPPGGGPYAAIDAAYNQSGKPYQYGAFDCSMYMSQIYAAMAGLPPGRYFTTETDFEALGFKKGFKPGALNVGIRRGGGGQNSHMAGTLPNGINVENTGGGSMYGEGAAGANSFPLQYYFEPPNGGDMGRMQMQAMAGQQGPADMAGFPSVAADPYAAGGPGGATNRTEGYIPAGAGNTSVAGTSFASGLLNMGAEAINGLIDQAASAAATAASAAATAGSFGAGGQAAGPAAAFAIGLGANAAKRGVSYGFQMAGIGTDALIEQLTPFGAPRWLSTDPTAFIPQMPAAPAETTTAEQSAVDPNTTAHGQGMGAAPGPMGGPADLAAFRPAAPGAQPVPGMSTVSPPTPPMNGQAPPPVQSQQQEWMKRLGIMPGVFDDGGWLEPGGVAVNKSNRPEPVFNGRQWDAIYANATGIPNPDPAAMGGVHFNDTWNVTVKDVDELEQQSRDRQRRRMKQYAGRPLLGGA